MTTRVFSSSLTLAQLLTNVVVRSRKLSKLGVALALEFEALNARGCHGEAFSESARCRMLVELDARDTDPHRVTEWMQRTSRRAQTAGSQVRSMYRAATRIAVVRLGVPQGDVGYLGTAAMRFSAGGMQ